MAKIIHQADEKLLINDGKSNNSEFISNKQREGEWKFHKDGSGTCSECHITQKNIWDYDNWQNFCGHCGAKMKGANDERK